MARRLRGGAPTRPEDKDPLALWAMSFYGKCLRLNNLSKKTGLPVEWLLLQDAEQVAALMEVNEAMIEWNNKG